MTRAIMSASRGELAEDLLERIGDGRVLLIEDRGVP
jgi:hypothetical protein